MKYTTDTHELITDYELVDNIPTYESDNEFSE